MRYTALLLATLLLTSGCYTTKLHYGAANSSRTSTHIRVQHTFLWGFLSPGSTDLTRVCDGSQVVSIQSQVAGLGLLANWLTAGVWIPMTLRIECEK